MRGITRRLAPFVATWAGLALTIVGLSAAFVALDTGRDRPDYVTTYHYLREYRATGRCGTLTGQDGRCRPAAVAKLEGDADRFWPDVRAVALPCLVAATGVIFGIPTIAAVYAATTGTRRAADARRQRRFMFVQEGGAETRPDDALPPLPPPPPGVRP